MRLLVHSCDWTRGTLDLQDHWLGDAMHGEIAGDSEAGAVFATLVLTKVAVGNCATSKKFALFRSQSRCAYARVHCCHVNGDIYSGFCDVCFIQRDGASNVAEVTPNIRQAHVEDREVDAAMRLVRNPCGGLREIAVV